LAREAARRYCRLVQVLSYLYITRDFEKLWHLDFLLHPYCEPSRNSNNN
jgi:hypothetical protein